MDKSKFKFFTDITTNASINCLLNIKRYNDKRKLNKSLIFVDPGVYELVKTNEYSEIDKLHHLASGNLNENEYISIDYPCDMNMQYESLFIQKSIDNNIKYADNLQYICTIQFKFQDYNDFEKRFYELEYIWSQPKKILGIGNLCRIKYPNEFTDKVFRLLLKNQHKFSWIHIYGMTLRLMRKYLPKFNCMFSTDSTKWTRAVSNKLKLRTGGRVCCRKDTRNEFFLEYNKIIKTEIINEKINKNKLSKY